MNASAPDSSAVVRSERRGLTRTLVPSTVTRFSIGGQVVLGHESARESELENHAKRVTDAGLSLVRLAGMSADQPQQPTDPAASATPPPTTPPAEPTKKRSGGA